MRMEKKLLKEKKLLVSDYGLNYLTVFLHDQKSQDKNSNILRTKKLLRFFISLKAFPKISEGRSPAGFV